MSKLWMKYENWSKLENRAFHVPVHVLEFCPECGLFCIFSIFFYPIQLYTSYTPQNHSKFILKSQFYSIHLSLHVYLQKPFLNYFQTTLIWVITKDQNIGKHGYIGNWILRKYRKYRKYRWIFLHKYRLLKFFIF